MLADPKRSTLARQFSWTLPANIIYGACNFLLLMTLNKCVADGSASTEVAGRFNWAMAVIAPLFMFANLRFSNILATDTRSEQKLKDYFIVRIALVAFVCALSIAISMNQIMVGELTKGLLVLALAATKAVEAATDLCCAMQQRIERMDRIAASMVANGLGMMTVFVLVYVASRDVVLATWGMFGARVLAFLLYDLPTARLAASDPCFQSHGNSPSGRERCRRLLWTALPLGGTAALLSLTSNLPKYVISEQFDDHMLGIYGSLAVTIQAGNLIFRAIEVPSLPRLARHLSQGDSKRFWGLLGKLIAIFATLGIAGSVVSLIVGGQILQLLFNVEYATMGGVLALVVLGTACAQIAGIIESSLIAARITTIQLPMHCLTAGLCFVLSLLLIPTMAIPGAVLAVTICRFPFMAIGVWLLRQKLRDSEASQVALAPPQSIRRAA